MGSSDVCPTEDAVLAFLEFLVDPMLPARSSRENPSESQQQAVAKQVHAVVLLYNYYHRKQYPVLEFLNFDSFCQLAVILKPTLLGHLKLTQISNYKELDDVENQLSLTEKSIMQACDISLTLDASREVPIAQGWPITKVTIFLVDSKKENCLLLISSITQGVWSVIEKDVEVSNQGLGSTVETNQKNKRKRVIQKSLRVESRIDSTDFQQLAYLAVKEATGITQTDLMILEDHVVYSVSKEKAAAQFYIMQCMKPVNEDAFQLPIKDVIDSLQGPLVIKNSVSWTVTPVVEYFHVLPYGGILSNWMNRGLCSNGLQDSRLKESPERMKIPGESAESNIQDSSHVNTGIGEGCSHKTTATDHKLPKEQDVSNFPNAFNGHWTSQIEEKCHDISNTTQCHNHQKVITSSHTASDLNDLASGVDFKLEMDSTARSYSTDCKIEKIASGNRDSDNNSSDPNGIDCYLPVTYQSNFSSGNRVNDNNSSDQKGIGCHSVVTYQSPSKHLEKIQSTMASKENILTETALKVLMGKRDKLSLQLRSIEDEIAECDKKIQTILNEEGSLRFFFIKKELERSLEKDSKIAFSRACPFKIASSHSKTGGEDDLTLKIESIIEGCNDVCLRSVTQERTNQLLEDSLSPQYNKRKKLPEAILTMQNPCQELDAVCYANNWILPTYHVNPAEGGFRAIVDLKGADFDCSSEGELRSSPREARESAAALILVKLRKRAVQSH